MYTNAVNSSSCCEEGLQRILVSFWFGGSYFAVRSQLYSGDAAGLFAVCAQFGFSLLAVRLLF